MITQKTATEIARIYRDLEAGEKILENVEKELTRGAERVGFHGDVENVSRKCKFEWPSSENSYTVYNVDPMIARAVIVAHLADQKAKLEKLNAVAELEVKTKETE